MWLIRQKHLAHNSRTTILPDMGFAAKYQKEYDLFFISHFFLEKLMTKYLKKCHFAHFYSVFLILSLIVPNFKTHDMSGFQATLASDRRTHRQAWIYRTIPGNNGSIINEQYFVDIDRHTKYIIPISFGVKEIDKNGTNIWEFPAAYSLY